jgi:hypothetical protein
VYLFSPCIQVITNPPTHPHVHTNNTTTTTHTKCRASVLLLIATTSTAFNPPRPAAIIKPSAVIGAGFFRSGGCLITILDWRDIGQANKDSLLYLVRVPQCIGAAAHSNTIHSIQPHQPRRITSPHIRRERLTPPHLQEGAAVCESSAS